MRAGSVLRIVAGRSRGGWLGGEFSDSFWKDAARQHNVELEESYDDEEVEATAEAAATYVTDASWDDVRC